MFLQSRAQFLGQDTILLRILDDRHQFLVLMRRNPGQPFQQLVSFQLHITLLCKPPRQQSIPDRMYVQNGMRARPLVIDHRVQIRLGRRLAAPPDCPSLRINLQQIRRRQLALIQARRSDQNVRSAAHAEVPACCRNPAARITPSRRLAQGVHF